MDAELRAALVEARRVYEQHMVRLARYFWPRGSHIETLALAAIEDIDAALATPPAERAVVEVEGKDGVVHRVWVTPPAEPGLDLCSSCGFIHRSSERCGPPAPAVTETADRLAEAMHEAYTYEDRDNMVPTLPFMDDYRGFWLPFARRVLAAAPAVTETADLRAALAELTGPVLARAWLLSGRSAPLLEPDEWDGFALTVRAIIETDRAALAGSTDTEEGA